MKRHVCVRDYPRIWVLEAVLRRTEVRGPRRSEQKWLAARARLFACAYAGEFTEDTE